MNSNTNIVKVIKTSSWVTRGGYLPSRIVLWEKSAKDYFMLDSNLRFVTHLEVDNLKGELSFYHGHYDMSLAQAEKDFQERIDNEL